MTCLRRCGIIGVALFLACATAWRVIVTSLAERHATDSPERALALESRNPRALLALAKRELAGGHPHAAAGTARELLRNEPLEGRAFGVLARAAEQEGEVAKARSLYEITVRRAPRDLYSRAWIIDALLRDGRQVEALEQIDILLRISPTQGQRLFPILVQLADAPEFAKALAHILAAKPGWRDGMLWVLLARGSHGAVDAVFSALQDGGGLSAEEDGRWLDHLMQAGLWGEAYSRWAGELALAPGKPLAAVYNGDFETEPSNTGFDWRISNSVGVDIRLVPVGDANSAIAARVRFSGRRVAQIDFEQTLLLAPGKYRLRFRARADALHSDKGLQWAIACAGTSAPLAVSAPLEGSFGWKNFDAAFEVPAQKCPAQRLWLRNPGAAAAGKEVLGDIWFDDFAIQANTVPDMNAP
ncbi:MAG: tetratricopeptide repeat protein [Gammaproteobacteria bacterium]